MVISSGIAWAHVGISPEEAPAGSVQDFTITVPTEKDLPTTQVRLEIPQGVEVTGVSAPNGWQESLEGGSIVWSGGQVVVGETQKFGFEARMPQDAGQLAFAAFQTYEDGSVVEWTGPPDSEDPAPFVTIVQSSGATTTAETHEHEGDHGATEAVEGAATEPTVVETSGAGSTPETGGTSPNVLYGLIFAGLLVLVGGGLFLLRGRFSQ